MMCVFSNKVDFWVVWNRFEEWQNRPKSLFGGGMEFVRWSYGGGMVK